jgi:glycosyltransferase involved in cell wall biosynthesis
MFLGKKVGVVITAYNEERFIEDVINTIPLFVDGIYVIDDASGDNTPKILSAIVKSNERLEVITHDRNMGVGAGKITGYKRALDHDMDITVMMAGDGQTDPAYLESIIMPVARGQADYAKGTRLSSSKDRKQMPPFRRFGNFVLTWLTRLSSGYLNVSDPQDGYTAISRDALRKLSLDTIYHGWAAENDILIKLNAINASVIDVPHPAKYGEEKSSIRYSNFVLTTSWILLRGFIWRIKVRYIDSFSRTFLRGVEYD